MRTGGSSRYRCRNYGRKLGIETTDENNHVVWKFGRTSHYTYVIASTILSKYRSNSSVISDEWMVINDNGRYRENVAFSTVGTWGDSGSFVWDSDGYVSGLLYKALFPR
ncbi:hypothetical protein M430DRAFT_33768 [Amorphotheca resinae ATCC 22711]|uniref:Uncharacterized protein n=1 Tax=Amorphotheca resinae ATCC 22711 TaxID=857342 RepID=A0A2T3B8Q7_AMORE|nr:hypothetical protein M430DRAFT_33768 [Amorphotheca resinae ATCC 22711]PSS23217.1 hypothetical protein M430DRAFT_33768 [Amorphotheca resinae ATCC 22711]